MIKKCTDYEKNISDINLKKYKIYAIKEKFPKSNNEIL